MLIILIFDKYICQKFKLTIKAGLPVQKLKYILCTSKLGDGDAPPIFVASIPKIKEDELAVFKKLFLRALNENQMLILRNINGKHRSLNALLEEISRDTKKPISTLKLNAKILKELGLIDYGEKHNPKPVELTKHGQLILKILEVVE